MATGDQKDFVARIKTSLPARWFPSTSSVAGASPTPILDALLSGVATGWAFIYNLVQYAGLQVRIATATDVMLDIISLDYFGGTLPRKVNEADSAFSARIRANMFPPLQTRAAIKQSLTTLTGRSPKIFEPTNPADTGAYNTGYLGYGGPGAVGAGGYGCVSVPFEGFVTAYRQTQGGIPSVGGYGAAGMMPAYAPGGYGAGALEYATLSMGGAQTLDSQIYATVASTQAAGVTAWTLISN